MPKGINITPQKFSEWLEQQPMDGWFTGVRCRTCPIARYLMSLGYMYANVGLFEALLGQSALSTKVYELPKWANTFIAWYDEDFEDTVRNAWSIVQDIIAEEGN